MPLTIALCDDNETQITELRRLLNEWAADKPLALAINEFNSAEGFLFSYPDKSCDLLLLDIEMKALSGMELAKKLRSESDMLPIIFITGYSEYMNDGYEVEALHYLLKPVDKQKLFSVLDKYLRRHTDRDQIMLQCRDEALHISPDEIVYCEAAGKYTGVSLANGRRLLCIHGISAVAKLLPECFVTCHRSYIVNLRYVRSIGKAEITLDSGEDLPLSRRLYNEVNGKFIEFYTKG